MSDVGNYIGGPRSNKDSFFNKMKKKPDVQAVLDNLENYTVEQLSNLEGTHFPQWIRDALVRKKEGMAKGDIIARAEDIAERMNMAAAIELPAQNIEYIPYIYIDKLQDNPIERKITSADFNTEKDRPGVILDSSTHGKHEDTPGFDEHMKRVHEQRRNKL